MYDEYVNDLMCCTVLTTLLMSEATVHGFRLELVAIDYVV